jgi:hypothetical protein
MYTNTTILYSLLESYYITYVIFLNFKATFDIVNYSLLTNILHRQGCPPQILVLIASLTFRDVYSYVVSDREASD